MWEALSTIANREEQSIHGLATEIDKWRGKTALTSAVRVFVLAYFQNLASDLETRLHTGQPAPEPTQSRPKGSSGAHVVLSQVFSRR